MDISWEYHANIMGILWTYYGKRFRENHNTYQWNIMGNIAFSNITLGTYQGFWKQHGDIIDGEYNQGFVDGDT